MCVCVSEALEEHASRLLASLGLPACACACMRLYVCVYVCVSEALKEHASRLCASLGLPACVCMRLYVCVCHWKNTQAGCARP